MSLLETVTIQDSPVESLSLGDFIAQTTLSLNSLYANIFQSEEMEKTYRNYVLFTIDCYLDQYFVFPTGEQVRGALMNSLASKSIRRLNPSYVIFLIESFSKITINGYPQIDTFKSHTANGITNPRTKEHYSWTHPWVWLANEAFMHIRILQGVDYRHRLLSKQESIVTPELSSNSTATQRERSIISAQITEAIEQRFDNANLVYRFFGAPYRNSIGTLDYKSIGDTYLPDFHVQSQLAPILELLIQGIPQPIRHLDPIIDNILDLTANPEFITAVIDRLNSAYGLTLSAEDFAPEGIKPQVINTVNSPKMSRGRGVDSRGFPIVATES